MKITFDPKFNIAYIKLKEKSGELINLKISEDLVLDLSPDGTVFGIELLNANEQLQDSLSFTNEVTGKNETVRI